MTIGDPNDFNSTYYDWPVPQQQQTVRQRELSTWGEAIVAAWRAFLRAQNKVQYAQVGDAVLRQRGHVIQLLAAEDEALLVHSPALQCVLQPRPHRGSGA